MRRAPLRGERQGAALHPPLRGDAPKGSALWTPAGAFAPDPRDAMHPHFACGRDGGFGALANVYSVLTGPPKGRRAGRCTYVTLAMRIMKDFLLGYSAWSARKKLCGQTR